MRTEWNVRDSDATLILNLGRLEGGTALTQASAEKLGRPCMLVDLASELDVRPVLDWLEAKHITSLNVAGPRGSKRPELYQLALNFLTLLLSEAKDTA